MGIGARSGLPVVVLLVLAGPHLAEAQTTFCQPVDVPWAAPNTTIAMGINNHGDVVGFYLDPIPNPNGDQDGVDRGFLLKDGQYSTVQVGPTNTEVYGINDAGQMVGEAGGRAFVITEGVPQFLDLGGGPNTASGATDINNRGDIVGFRRDAPDFRTKGFYLEAGGLLFAAPYPGIQHDFLYGINDSGLAVGWAADGFRSAAFTWRPALGATRVSDFPGGFGTTLAGINNAGLMVGTFASFDAAGGGSFERPFGPSGRPTRFTCPDVGGVQLTGINDLGAVVGQYGDAGGQGNHSFYTPSIRMVDPVPDLVRSSRDVTTNATLLATAGRDVQGIAADGVSQVLLRIPVAQPGATVTVKVYQDETTPSTDVKRYGALGKPGDRCPGDGCSQSAISVTSTSAAGVAFAFVVYRAPEDFPRDDSDAGLKFRDVRLRIESDSGVASLPLRVVRPPVAVIHGLWGDDSLWQEFRPLVWGTDQSDPRFAVFRINYGGNIGAQVAETQPHYAAATQAKTTGSALGFERNAGEAQSQIRRQLATFKNGRNPAAMSVAAVQVDVIGHSMGGNVTRTMPLLRDFLQGNTYGQGIVHKLITVDTPHRGSTLANLLVGQIRGGHFCVPFFLADWGKSVVLRSATLRDGSTVSGAVGDLVPGSDAQQRMDGQRVRQIPTATVAGVYTNWSYLSGHDVGGLPVPNFAVNLLHETCKLDALALSLNQVTWPTLFGEDSDATVGLSSQDPFNVGRHFQNYVHSPGMVSLGFAPPPIISSENGGEVAAHVISLLNKPLSDTAYMKLP